MTTWRHSHLYQLRKDAPPWVRRKRIAPVAASYTRRQLFRPAVRRTLPDAEIFVDRVARLAWRVTKARVPMREAQLIRKLLQGLNSAVVHEIIHVIQPELREDLVARSEEALWHLPRELHRLLRARH